MDKRACMSLLAGMVLVSCGGLAQQSEATSPDSTYGQTSSATAAPTAAASAPAQSAPTLAPSPEAVQLPPGLLIAMEGAGGIDLWVVEKNGEMSLLLDRVAPPTFLPDFDVSRGGKQILYAYEGDIWLFDTQSHQKRNVTQTSDRIERVPRWLPDSASFICGSAPAPAQSPDLGYLTLVDSGNSSYTVLDDQGMLGAPPAASPDGSTIAYSRYSPKEQTVVPFLYHLPGREVERFDLAKYGADWPRVGEASWSPDGQRLAWGLLGEFEGQWQAGVAIFDLNRHSHILLHHYAPMHIGGFIPAPSWGPDGDWVVFYSLAENPAQQGLWLAQSAEPAELISSELSRPSLVKDPAVSPDGKWVATVLNSGDGVGIVEVGKWKLSIWHAPKKVSAVSWSEAARAGPQPGGAASTR